MAEFKITCPACGQSFDYYERNDFVFCTSCGKKLKLTWSVECSVAEESFQCSTGPSTSTTGFSSGTGTPCGGGYQPGMGSGRWARVHLMLPSTPVRSKGKFEYFGIKWDGADIADGQLNVSIPIDTTIGRHMVEIRQVNSTLFSAEVKKFSFSLDIRNDCVIDVFCNDTELIIRN